SAEIPRRCSPRPTGSRHRSAFARQRRSSMPATVLSQVVRRRGFGRPGRRRRPRAAAGNNRDEGNRSPRERLGRAAVDSAPRSGGRERAVAELVAPGDSEGSMTVSSDKIRNVALVGHGGAGKTTLAEALLYVAGAVPRMGKVEDGTTTTDFDPEEQRRRISV